MLIRYFLRSLYSLIWRAEFYFDEERNKHIRAAFAHCGNDVILRGRCQWTGMDKITIGNNVSIGEGAFIKGDGGLTIGNNVSISRNLVLYTMNHNYEGKRLPYDETMIYKPVVIEDNVWIGMNVCIAPGTHIHEGAVIGLGANVSGDVPKGAVIGNQPYRTLKLRNTIQYDSFVAEGRVADTDGNPY